MIYARVPSFLGLRLEDGHVPIFWLLLYVITMSSAQRAGVFPSIEPQFGLFDTFYWVAVKEFTMGCRNPKTISSATYP